MMVVSTTLLALIIVNCIIEAYSLIRGSDNVCDVSLYYSNIDSSLMNNDLKKALKNLILPHKVIDYDTIWNAFPTIDIYLPRYPCNVNTSFIPDVYSAYCWDAEKNLVQGGECGNYKKEGDCFNREHLWPKSWFGGFDYGKIIMQKKQNVLFLT